MASLTSVESGNWSDPTVWDLGSVPQDSDTVTIANGHTVVFDVDQSTFSDGVALTINSGGKLTAPTSGGPYYLKCSANITLNGTLELGTVGSPVPKNVSITIDLNDGRTITCGANSVISIICPNPQNICAYLTQDVNSDVSVLPIDRNVSSDWAAGDILYIFGKGDTTKEQRVTLVSAGSNSITINPALSTSQLAGSIIAHCSRNIKITKSTQANAVISLGSNTAANFSCFIDVPNLSSSYVFGAVGNANILGGAYISGYSTIDTTKCYVSDTVLRGISNVIASSKCVLINSVAGRSAYATINARTACAYARNCSVGAASLGVLEYSRGVIRDSVLRGAYGVARTHDSVIDNCLFDNTIAEIHPIIAPNQYFYSLNHNQVAGAFKSWSKGGITVSSTPPAGAIGSGWYKLMLTSSSDFGFYQMPITVYPGRYIRFASKVLITDNMTYAPKFQIVDPFNDPLVASNATPLSEYDMAGYNPNTLYQITLTYKNTGDVPKTVFFRVIGRNSSGSVYFTVETRDNRCENVRLWPIPYV